MRQGEVGSQGKWTGSALGGVKAPEPIVLPDPAVRFAATAARLNALAPAHPMQDWLGFMAQLAEAQHVAAVSQHAFAEIEASSIEQAVDARMPPLAADGHVRQPAWRDGLRAMLGFFDGRPLPAEARAVVEALKSCDASAVDALADAFLRGSMDEADAGPALYIAAALQVYFSCLSARLPVAALRLLPQRGLCPCCGSTPVASVVTASGQTPGTRYLVCSLCSTAWNHVRAVCITCGESGGLRLEGIDGDAGIAKAETCDDCRTYSKMFYQAKDMKVDAFADDLATLGLDVLGAEEGWSRHAPNPLLLIG